MLNFLALVRAAETVVIRTGMVVAVVANLSRRALEEHLSWETRAKQCKDLLSEMLKSRLEAAELTRQGYDLRPQPKRDLPGAPAGRRRAWGRTGSELRQGLLTAEGCNGIKHAGIHARGYGSSRLGPQCIAQSNRLLFT